MIASPPLNLELGRPPSRWRALLTLSRASNLPTVWTNCLAGLWLGGTPPPGGLARFIALLAGTSFLYIGGMFLNDAFDADYDRLNRRRRPIPSGAIAEKAVWQWGAVWTALGAGSLAWMGRTTAMLTLGLVVFILTYNAIHKAAPFAPLIMGGCRLFVYLIAASTGAAGVTGWAVWAGLALAGYVAGLSFLAQKEAGASRPEAWPVVLLTLPLGLNALVNDGLDRRAGSLIAAALAGWILWALASTFWKTPPRTGFTVGRLLAAVTLVDLLAVGGMTGWWTIFFPIFFATALILQRFIPAT